MWEEIKLQLSYLTRHQGEQSAELKKQGEKIDSQGETIKDLYRYVTGNPLYGQKGIVYTLNDHEKRIKILEGKKKRNKWILWGATSGAGITGVVSSAAIKSGIVKLLAFLKLIT